MSIITKAKKIQARQTKEQDAARHAYEELLLRAAEGESERGDTVEAIEQILTMEAAKPQKFLDDCGVVKELLSLMPDANAISEREQALEEIGAEIETAADEYADERERLRRQPYVAPKRSKAAAGAFVIPQTPESKLRSEYESKARGLMESREKAKNALEKAREARERFEKLRADIGLRFILQDSPAITHETVTVA